MILLDAEVDGAEDLEGLEADAARLLAGVGRPAATWSITLVDDATIRAINLTWRGLDEATDVLSFPQDEAPGPEDVLGDVMISVETAQRQAMEHNLTLYAELRVLLVHGLLHLLGYDHHTPDQVRVMRAEEGRLLRLLLGAGAPAGLVDAGVGAGDEAG